MELVSAAQMRALEAAGMASGVSGVELMERAGAAALKAILDWRPDLRVPRHAPALVLCGPGNNGGDGYVIARLMRGMGFRPTVYRYAPDKPQPEEAAEAARRWAAAGGETRPWDDDEIEERIGSFDDALVVDALLGMGTTRRMPSLRAFDSFEPSVWSALGSDDPSRRRHVAIDVPSGLCSETGASLGCAFSAQLTLAIQALKPGHVLIDRRAGGHGGALGEVQVLDIGLPARLPDDAPGPRSFLLDAPEARAQMRALRPLWQGHKFAHGHVLVPAGGVGKGGAARLAARAALRTGAGLVTVCPPPSALIENAARLDAVMLRAVADADAFAAMLEDRRIRCVALGMGLGADERRSPRTRALVEAALAAASPADAPSSAGPVRSAVLDADALTVFAQDPEALFALTRGRAAILTPHAGEFARLFPDLAARLSSPVPSDDRWTPFGRLEAAREAAARAGCTVLLKGPDTVIADPDGEAWVHAAVRERASPWLATAGAGDVLAGIIAGLASQRGAPRARLAAFAAWLHVEAARAFGPGLIAEDLPDQLPGVMRGLLAASS
ncbi:NAD(P)H-hydrate dehydratase [Albimonas pacifica]|uniref:Bifunctional NAD(P)H-hydrate repair enzyme n=1 Tax=Albimonas pacifica TaxID=1114924 RepID=A0A1I3EKG7_9RHOB|nr:NAD(P)H-hydrate dehydratase [Albimonas pacifica]SFH99201.1 yjeF C-terminal region, hydroxyethylthiazole kinase-related/yjeF N-terminal region [Albimonas pacifica]